MARAHNTPHPAHSEATVVDNTEAESNPAAQIFRAEALAYYTAGRRNQGDLLRIAPTWTRWSYWLLLAVFVVGLGGAMVGTVDQYVSGAAVVMLNTSTADNPSQPPTIFILLPGYTRPQLQSDLPVHLTLEGYPQAYQTLTIEAIDDHISSPAEVRRRLGPRLADLAPTGEAVVLVQAHPQAATFVANGQTLAYYTGMQGTAALRVRSERILFVLMPALRTWFVK